MRFLWFGRKKRPTLLVAPEPERKLVEIFSVTDFVCETNPLQGVKGSQLEAHTIYSYILSLLSGGGSPADLAAQEFFQERGGALLPILDYSHSPDRGYSARIVDAELQRTVLMGTHQVVARASAPFAPMILNALELNPEAFVVAIDGIAYASFAVVSELS